MIILAISLVGEILKYTLPLPIPASIYGMAILFAGLMSGLDRWMQFAKLENFL